MSSANRRAALGALDRVRPLVAGLHRTRPNEELATDIGRAWELTEVALRALLGGSSLAGQSLVREVRQRELISLEAAHALVNFHAAKDRAELPGYQIVAGDVSAAREAVGALDGALGGTVATGGSFETAPLPPAAPAGVAAGLPREAAPMLETAARGRGRGLPAGVILLLVALVVVALGLGAWWLLAGRGGATGDLAQAQQLYSQGQREQARLAFATVARARPELALPHIYLARIAREQGEVAVAQQELATAIRLEPNNPLGHREMGSLMLATNNPEVARRFYVRAVELDPNDRIAQGYLGCALVRLGNTEAATRFLDRAGPGDWSACARQVPPAAMAPPQQGPLPR